MSAVQAVCAAVLVHRPEIMLGVLQVIFRRDEIAALSLAASQLQIALIFPLRILREADVIGFDFQ